MSLVVAGAVMAGQSQDRFTLKTANGVAFAEFSDYEDWPLVATSLPDDAGGCGSRAGCTKAILGNPAMLKAYREGIPANGQAVPDGAAMAKVEWLKGHETTPYGATVPAAQSQVAFMVKDAKRFPDTNGWGYATFEYRRGLGDVQGHQTNHGVERPDDVPRLPHGWGQGARLRIHPVRQAVSTAVAHRQTPTTT